MKIKKIVLAAFIVMLMFVLAACGASGPDGPTDGDKDPFADYLDGGNTYTEIVENPFVEVTAENNKSVISLSVNTASYSDVRNQILKGNKVNPSAVKIEEMVNYFRYDYTLPEAGKPLSMNAVAMDTPWNEETKLVLIGMRAEDIDIGNVDNNVVLLVDVSGSMAGADRLALVKESFSMLIDELDANDTVSIVTYANGVKVVADGIKCTAANKPTLKNALLSLKADGATAGGDAITKAYTLAAKHKTATSSNSVIIATDGDFNVGVSDKDALTQLIAEKKEAGISLSAVGVGFGNMKSTMLETIADEGGGKHIYLSGLTDARKFFVEELGGILNIVAYDAKAQVEFNPSIVKSYRLIGYENRTMSLDEWDDDSAQAGTIGSGTMITAMYEVKLRDVENDPYIGAAVETFAENPLAGGNVSIRYKTEQNGEVKEDNLYVDESFLNPVDDSLNPLIIKEVDRQFISAVIEVSLLLRGSKYAEDASYLNAAKRIVDTGVSDKDSEFFDPYKYDFVQVIAKIKT